MAISVLSVDGKLRSLFDRASVDEPRSQGYAQVDVGNPLLVRYLYFYLKHDDREDRSEVMISTFIRTKESKEKAAEAVNLFDRELRFDRQTKDFHLVDFGAHRYGHPLVYYTKSYLGQSLYLTTKIMELDKVDKKVVAAIQKGIGTVAGLPAFAQFLPYAVGASVGVSLFEKIGNLFNRDDDIVRAHPLDLHFGSQNVRRLQSGRIVCIQGQDREDDFVSAGKYRLSTDNRLVDAASGKEYDETSYFVLQVDAKANDPFEKFDYFLGAADLLEQTNRGTDLREVVAASVELFEGWNDVEAMRQIERLSVKASDAEVKKKILALHGGMSPTTSGIYAGRVKELTSG